MQKEHYNLYYLFLEDKLAHPLADAKRDEIRNILIEIFEKKRNAADCIERGAVVENKEKILKI